MVTEELLPPCNAWRPLRLDRRNHTGTKRRAGEHGWGDRRARLTPRRPVAAASAAGRRRPHRRRRCARQRSVRVPAGGARWRAGRARWRALARGWAAGSSLAPVYGRGQRGRAARWEWSAPPPPPPCPLEGRAAAGLSLGTDGTRTGGAGGIDAYRTPCFNRRAGPEPRRDREDCAAGGGGRRRPHTVGGGMVEGGGITSGSPLSSLHAFIQLGARPEWVRGASYVRGTSAGVAGGAMPTGGGPR